MTTLSCGAQYGYGGLGRHFAQLVEEARSRGELEAYFCPSPRPGDAVGHEVAPRAVRPMLVATPIRFSSAWRTYAADELFDRSVARSLRRTEKHVGFAGQSLRTFKALEADVLELVSPTAHVDLLERRYAEAVRAYPLERPWLNRAGRRKALAEYRRADAVQVASEYAYESFLDAGLPAEKLRRVRLSIPGQYTANARERDDDTFRVLYVGALTVAKGVPVLVDAFRQLPGQAELRLVGGWSSRGMRRYLQRCLAADPRIRVVSNDPLLELREADVLVHPSFSDGFGYAPMEALACGIPVVVTEDTGMKENIREGIDGWIIPTGNAGQLLERLTHVRRHPQTATVVDGSRG